MDKYSDLDFFLNKNYKTNDISLKKEIDALSQSVKNIILTDPGERMFDPYFGAGIPETIFEQYDWRDRLIVEEKIKTAVSLYEPRVKIQSINIDYTLQNTLLIEVSFYPIDKPSSTTTLSVQI